LIQYSKYHRNRFVLSEWKHNFFHGKTFSILFPDWKRKEKKTLLSKMMGLLSVQHRRDNFQYCSFMQRGSQFLLGKGGFDRFPHTPHANTHPRYKNPQCVSISSKCASSAFFRMHEKLPKMGGRLPPIFLPPHDESWPLSMR
jgi:hypothetical protein